MIQKAKTIEHKKAEHPKVCYICEENAAVKCMICKLPVCHTHQQKVEGNFPHGIATLCDACTDYYVEMVSPRYSES